jgi:hypothetical protein
MRYVEAIFATTHVDRHGDKLTHEALLGVVEQIRQGCVPMMFNHDPRVPPIGRLVDAEVRELDDGEFALVSISEVFEPGDELPPLSDSREMSIRRFSEDAVHVVYDRSYLNSDERAILDALEALDSIKMEEEGKKALEPVSILLIGLMAAGGAIAAGFLNKLGADAWDYLREKLKELLARKRQQPDEYLVIIEIQTQRGDQLLSVQTILSSPLPQDLDQFLDHGLPQLESLFGQLMTLDPSVRKVVLMYTDNRLSISYAIRKDSVPLQIVPRSNEE